MDVNAFIVQKDAKISDVMRCINLNHKGICFVVDENNAISGVITDGDIRRFILKYHNIEELASNVMNINYTALPLGSSSISIRMKLNNHLKCIPLLDDQFNIRAIAHRDDYPTIPILEPELNGNEFKYVNDCLISGWISSQGKYVIAFEEQFNKLFPEYTSVAVSNGTVALHLALVALGIKEGDEVIVPNLTFAATINSVLYCGATPVLCDVAMDDWCLDLESLKGKITDNTKAIIPVHLYGKAAKIDAICKLAASKKIMVIEDCAEALGSSLNNSLCGSFGDAATFSFFGNKTITTGEGGMVLFRDTEQANRAKVLRDHGMSKIKRYWHDEIGFNYRMTNIQAAIGVAQMERLEKILFLKRNIRNWYNSILSNSEFISFYPSESSFEVNSNWLYTILIKKTIDIDEVMIKMNEYGIQTRRVFYPLDVMPIYKEYGADDTYVNSHCISKYGISLPTSINLKEMDVCYIAQLLLKVLNDQ